MVTRAASGDNPILPGRAAEQGPDGYKSETEPGGYSSLGGGSPQKRRMRRKLISSGRFRCRAPTVARPLAVALAGAPGRCCSRCTSAWASRNNCANVAAAKRGRPGADADAYPVLGHPAQIDQPLLAE